MKDTQLTGGAIRITTPQSMWLRALAQRVADALPPEIAQEVVLTGSVSRGVADDVSDIEMLIVTGEQLELSTCFELARAAGLAGLDTWGMQAGPTRRVSGHRDGYPLELVWWSRAHAEAAVDAVLCGEATSIADALAHGKSLRTNGLLDRWKTQLSEYPHELAQARIEDAALTWGGFAPAGLLTLARPMERLALLERLVDDASRVVQIIYAINRVWQPTHKRLASRVETLAVKPERLAERVEEALTDPDPRRALLTMTRLQADTADLAPNGPNIRRARTWLAEAAQLLGPHNSEGPVADVVLADD